MMFRFIPIACLLVTPALGATPVQASEDSSEVFEQELARVARKMESGAWEVALRRLESVLERHAGRGYVLEHLGEVELALKRCIFWSDHAEVDLQAGLAGKLSYDLGTGEVQLTYEAGAPTDFERQAGAELLPILFTGTYSIELTGGPEPAIIVCAKEQQSVAVSFHRSAGPGKQQNVERTVELHSRLRRADGELLDEAQSREFTSKEGARSYTVVVNSTTVQVLFNGQSLLTQTKPKDLWGQVVFAGSVPNAHIVVAGEARAWLQNRLDQAVAGDWRRFERSWKLEQHLPQWMRAALVKGSDTTPAAATGLSPSDLTAQGIEQWNDSVAKLEAEDYTAALARIEALLGQHPQLGEGHRLKAKALLGLRKSAEAAQALEQGIEQLPGYLTLRRDLAELLLVTGHFERALEVIGAAVAAGSSPTDLQDLSITANKALRGPAWGTKNEYGSRHYSVASSLPRETCREVALELEETFRHVSRRLRLGEHATTKKYQVYIFSSNERYQDYITDVFGGRGESTLGMYSPFLKQLLILDSAQHDSLMHTVRHEGFHQLLDSELDDPPSWLNEGLAEYFAAARTERGGWDDGQLNRPRLAVLQTQYRGRLMPLSTFLYQDRASFLKDAALGYGQAWGLVHYLNNSTRENQATLDSLIDSLRSGLSNREAIDKAFKGRDLAKIDAKLSAFIEKL